MVGASPVGPGLHFKFDVYGDVQVDRRLMRVSERAFDMIPVFEEIHADFLAIEEEQFSSQGGRGSGGWRPLAPSTLDEKRRGGFDLRILHRTLRMRKSLTEPSHSDHVFRVTPMELVMGTKVKSKKGYPYPRAHQVGAGLPQRRPIELTETDRIVWIKMIQRYVVTGEVLPR